MSTVGMTRFQPVMTEVERQRLFLERAASVLAERVLQLEDVVQERIYRNLEELYLEKDDPLQTTDDEFEGIYILITDYVFPPAFVEAYKRLKEEGVQPLRGSVAFL